MTEYLIQDGWTTVGTWIAAPSMREALIAHSNANPDRTRKIQNYAQMTIYSHGDNIDVCLGGSYVIGRRVDVTRKA